MAAGEAAEALASRKYSPGVVDMIAGTAGGVAQIAVGHPFDTVKTLLQTNARQGSMMSVFRGIFAEEGLRGLYKGAASPLLGAMAHNAVVFFAYGTSKRIFQGDYTPSTMPLHRFFLAGATAASVITLVEGPVDLFKVKAMMKLYPSSLSAAKHIVMNHGFRGAYQGIDATMLRNIPCFGLYFTFFEGTRRMLTSQGQEPSLLATFAAGGAAGFGFWGVLYPLETIKTVCQADPYENRQYRSAFDAAKKIYARGGITAFYGGYTPSLVRALFINSCIFTAVTVVKKQLS